MRRWMKVLLVVVLGAFGFWLGWAHAQDGKAKTERKKLERAQEVNGIPCAKDYAWFYAGGKLQRCTTSREVGFGMAQVPAGSIVAVLEDGRPDYAMMVRDVEVAGVTCSGGNRVLGPGEGAMTTFYPSGKLKQCFLAEDQDVLGVPCRASGMMRPDAGVELFEDGRLKSCTLAKEYGGDEEGRAVGGEVII